VNLVVRGRRCLVVGGGSMAATRAAELIECGARVHVIAPTVSDELRALGLESIDQRPYQAGDAEGYLVVVAATDDSTVNRLVFEDGSAHGALVNSVDDPEHCTFTTPARIRRGSLVVTVSTEGRSPAVASWLRERLEHELGPEYGVLVDIVAQEREAIRATGGATTELDWQKALESGMLDLIREGRLAEAKERLQACLSSPSG
jgi:precorrin-2 dehydrogenase/sirohydrochlorin ferrochelatase